MAASGPEGVAVAAAGPDGVGSVVGSEIGWVVGAPVQATRTRALTAATTPGLLNRRNVLPSSGVGWHRDNGRP
ncbi:hypothetical protein [Ornithinimicrobium faecis]|uniref:hypothetical protein n=1 Tax=Ornithinimicrobium faecis TaxID=2934158 RepID=UPI0021185AB1|nr:hypothetical protein [Ornithinimicrobium sp. HY1745]